MSAPAALRPASCSAARYYRRDEWLDQVPRFGGFSRLPAATQQALLAGIGAAVDALGGSFTMRYATVAASAART
jgi:hypothetical protein